MESGKSDNAKKPFQTFEDILVWQRAESLTLSIYKIFRSSRDYGFRDQICRAAVSVMNNIAEGFERQSKDEFRRFLFIAKGSSGEVRSMLSLARELNYISLEDCSKLKAGYTEMSKMLAGLIKSLQ